MARILEQRHESFNGRLRDELLNEHAFPTLFLVERALNKY